MPRKTEAASSRNGTGVGKGAKGAKGAKGRRRGARGPSRDQIEELFWRSELDLLVDGARLYLGEEFVEMLREAGKLSELSGGRCELLLEQHVFRLGPYLADVDGRRVRWVGVR